MCLGFVGVRMCSPPPSRQISDEYLKQWLSSSDVTPITPFLKSLSSHSTTSVVAPCVMWARTKGEGIVPLFVFCV